MKRIILITIAIICITVLCVHPSASANQSFVIRIENTDVIFDNHTSLTEEEMQRIAVSLMHNEQNVQTYGLWCNLFGHKNQTEYVTTITHEVNPVIPRCLQERWEVITCTRCGNTEGTRLSYSYIDCCPED